MPEPAPRAAFLYVLAQPEAKSWLCAELSREHPDLRIAFNRPGLYSFKHASDGFGPDFRLKSVFARHYGYSLGRAKLVADVQAMLTQFAGPLRVHVLGRDAGEGKLAVEEPAIVAARECLLLELGPRCKADPEPHAGDWVLDVILPPADDPDPSWFIGYHRHDPSRSPFPGSVTRHAPPAIAPSRAWSKLEELLQWSSLPMRRGDTAVEIGCAPGGAVVAMLDRGLRVVGVDPAAIDPRVIEHALTIGADFLHLPCAAAALKREQLPAKVDWLLCDANLAPQVAMRYLAHACKQLRPHLRGLIFTMKMNDQRVVDAIPKLVARIAEFGLGEARAVQLPSHRREIAVVAWRRPRHR